MPLNPRTYAYPHSKTTTGEFNGDYFPIDRRTGNIINLEPVVGNAPQTQDELNNALNEVNRRRVRDNVISGQIADDSFRNTTGIHEDAGVMNNRQLTSKVINGKKYIVNENGEITNTVSYDRILTPDEYQRLNSGDQSVLNKRNRARGNTYVESQQIVPTNKPAEGRATSDLKTAVRSIRMRNKIREGMMKDGAEMSANQKDVAERWRKERAFGGTHSARRQVELSAEQQQREQQQREQQITLADKAAAAKAEELASQERIAMVNAQAAKYGHDQALAIAQANKNAQENVARITATGQVLAAGQRGSNTQDYAKRANEYISLAQKLATGGTMNDADRVMAEFAIRNNKELSEEQKALQLKDLQSGNFGYLANFLLAQAQGLYEQGGITMPLSPAHATTSTSTPTATPTTPPSPTTPPATNPTNPRRPPLNKP
jgi:hypothetical protein